MNDLVNKKVIRDRGFAQRLETACENHQRAPSGHGRQTWLRRQLEEQFELSISPEAVRKWFSGESRPRPKVMTEIAQLLRVDEAWLSLGIKPAATPTKVEKMSVTASGAVNLVAAQIQLTGGTIAYREKNADYDIFAVIRGQRHEIAVRLGERNKSFKATFPQQVAVLILVMPTDKPTVFRFFRLPLGLLSDAGKSRGWYTEISLSQTADGEVICGKKSLTEIVDFTNLPVDSTETE